MMLGTYTQHLERLTDTQDEENTVCFNFIFNIILPRAVNVGSPILGLRLIKRNLYECTTLHRSHFGRLYRASNIAYASSPLKRFIFSFVCRIIIKKILELKWTTKKITPAKCKLIIHKFPK